MLANPVPLVSVKLLLTASVPAEALAAVPPVAALVKVTVWPLTNPLKTAVPLSAMVVVPS